MANFLGWRNDGFLAIIFVLALSLNLAACSPPKIEQFPTAQTVLSADVAPGTLLIDVTEPGRPEHYWQYEVRPSSGSVLNVKEETFPDHDHADIPHVFQEPAGATFGCLKEPRAVSPDGAYVAYCKSIFTPTPATFSGTRNEEFFLADTKTGQILYHWQPTEYRRIWGFAWAPNSRSVAFLNTSSYNTKGWEFAITHNTVHLNILDVRTTNVTTYEIRREVIYCLTRILSWSN